MYESADNDLEENGSNNNSNSSNNSNSGEGSSDEIDTDTVKVKQPGFDTLIQQMQDEISTSSEEQQQQQEQEAEDDSSSSKTKEDDDCFRGSFPDVVRNDRLDTVEEVSEPASSEWFNSNASASSDFQAESLPPDPSLTFNSNKEEVYSVSEIEITDVQIAISTKEHKITTSKGNLNYSRHRLISPRIISPTA